MFIDLRSGEKYLEKIEFDYNRVEKLINFISNEAKYVDIHIEGDNSFAKFKICFTDEEIEVNQGDVLLRSVKEVPQTMPTLHYYKSVHKEEFSRNFKPLEVETID